MGSAPGMHAGYGDRDKSINVLREAFVEGRLTQTVVADSVTDGAATKRVDSGKAWAVGPWAGGMLIGMLAQRSERR